MMDYGKYYGWTSTGGCGHSAPTTGDSLVATASGGSLTIIVPNDGVTHLLGTCPSANTTYDLQLTAVSAGSAVLDVQPSAKFYFCGNKKLTSVVTAAGGTPTVWADLRYETGATVYEDEAQAAYAHRTVTGATNEWARLLWGSSSDTCTFGPGTAYSCPTSVLAVNAASVYPVAYSPNSTTDSHIFQIYGTSVRFCGSATVGCLDYETAGNVNTKTYTGAGVVALGGDVFDTTGTLQSSGGFVDTMRLSLSNTHFVNDLVGVGHLNGQDDFTLTSCTISGNYFSLLVGQTNEEWAPCYFSGNVFADGLQINGQSSFPQSSFNFNVLMIDCASSNDADRSYNVPFLNNYVSCFTNASSNHLLTDSSWNMTYRGNFMEVLTPGSGEGHFIIGSYASTMTATVLDNLILPAPSGLSSGQVEGWNWGNSDSSAYIDHNGSYATPYGSWFPFLNHTGQPASTTTILKSLRANIGFSPGANSSNIALNSWQGGGTTAEVQSTSNNNVVVAQEGWNGWYNAASDNTFNSTLADTNCNPSTSSNTPYQQCTVSGTPGTHDVVGNPNLIDRSRGMRTWASIKHGQAATVAGVQAAFQGCQNLQACIMELEAWVRQGYQPTNLAYKGAAHDGGVVGVSGTPGSGYSGACSASVTVQDANDLGTGAALSCSFVGGIPVVTVVNPGMHYRVATPATVTINGTGGSGAALNVMVSPSDIGPVPITLFAGVAP